MSKPQISIAGALAAALLVTAGCGSRSRLLVQSSARTAADQLVALQTEVQQKARSESEYYHQELGSMMEALDGARGDDFQALLREQAQSFDPADPGAFFTDFLDSWSAREASRREQIQTITGQLDAAQVTLDLNTAKIGDLLSKLRALGEAPSRGELARFIFDFAGSTYQELEAARQEANPQPEPPAEEPSRP